MNYKIMILINALLFCGGVFAQEIITTQGDYFINGTGSLSFTIGEPIGETFSGASNDLTQGFQQAELIATLVKDNLEQPNVTIYPNPVANYLTINMGDYQNQATFSLYDTQGKLVKTEKIRNTSSIVDFSNYAKGIYFLNLQDQNNQLIKSDKIVKQ